jgi:hypothetical protein
MALLPTLAAYFFSKKLHHRFMKKSITTLFLLFACLAAVRAQIVITEIMYNPPPSGTDTLEYVELYNNSNAPVDVSNWLFTEGVTFTFPAGTTIPAMGYVIVTENKAYFDARFPGLTTFQWDGALTNGGEDFRLTLPDSTTEIDYVNYLDAAPWPGGQANGLGASIVLCDYNADNNNGANWEAASTPTGVSIAGTPILANPGAASGCSGGGNTYTPYAIAEVTGEDAATGVADSVGVSVELTGIVYGVNLRESSTGLQFTLINDDNSAGITVFSPSAEYGYTVTEGDQITVQGTIVQFNGLTQIQPDTIIFNTSGNGLANPEVVAEPSEATESRLIRINNLVLVDPAQWTTGMGTGFTVQAVSPDNPQDTISIRIDNDVDLFNAAAPTLPFDLIGLGGQFDNSSPFTSGYQIAPRSAEDLLISESTFEADFSASVRLQPNPAIDRLVIAADLDFDAVRLVSPVGQLLATFMHPARQMQLPVRELPAGVYYLRFEKDGGVWMTRFVKGN